MLFHHLTRTVTCFFLLCLSVPGFAQAQVPLRAMDAYQYAQDQRQEARQFWQPDTASPDSIRRGIAVLEQTLTYLDSTLVRDLANGNPFLRGRRHDVHWDLANAYAQLKDTSQTIMNLERMLNAGSSSLVTDWLAGNQRFDFIRRRPEYISVIRRLKRQGEFWAHTALQTPYRENLPEDEKIAGISLLWTMAKQNFAYFDQVPHLNWDSLYLAYLPKVKQTGNTLEYYQLLQQMCAQLQDGHTNVYVPEELSGRVYGRPPVRTALIEDKVLLIEVNSDSLRKSGLIPGLEVISIDGVPVKVYARERVAPFQSSSTPQDLDVRTYGYFLLAGPEDEPVTIELKDARSRLTKRILPRQGYPDVQSRPRLEFKVLKGNIAYVALNSFEDEKVVQAFDSIFPDIEKTQGLIIDVRNNGGGNSGYGYAILGYLTDTQFPLSQWKSRLYQPVMRAWGLEDDWIVFPTDEGQPNGKKRYTQPVAVVMGPRTFSAAEDFLVAFDSMKRGKMLGEASGGSTGQPLFFSLPGGGSARICAKRDSYPNGKEFVGVGVQPDSVIKPTVKDIQMGIDPVMKAAINYLHNFGR
jgi:carboxyl-terminal processing protease